MQESIAINRILLSTRNWKKEHINVFTEKPPQMRMWQGLIKMSSFAYVVYTIQYILYNLFLVDIVYSNGVMKHFII